MKVTKIFGPPGTGKTRLLIKMFESELRRGVAPDRVGFFTFTRAARDEASDRVDRPLDELPWLRTIHSACYRALRVVRDQIVTGKTIRTFGHSIGANLTGTIRDPWFSIWNEEREIERASTDDAIIQSWHLARHRGTDLSQTLPMTVDPRYARWLVDAYETWKRNEGLIDYTDLISDYVQGSTPLDVDVLFIDEAQDLSWLQWQAVKIAAANVDTLVVAGDDDQAIFSWAGARAELLNELPADERVVLPRSYRLPRAVFELSRRVIARVKTRTVKEFEPRDAQGSIVRVGGDICRDDVLNETLILFRNNHRAAAIATRLEEIDVPFAGTASPLSAPFVANALRAWRALARDELVTRDDARAIVELAHQDWLTGEALTSTRDRGGMLRWESILLRRPVLEDWSKALARIPKLAYLTRAARRSGGLDALTSPKVRLMSIHQAKGREAHTVLIDPSMARKSYEQLHTADADDEHRVWYVAVTRTRERLILLMSSEDKNYEF